MADKRPQQLQLSKYFKIATYFYVLFEITLVINISFRGESKESRKIRDSNTTTLMLIVVITVIVKNKIIF